MADQATDIGSIIEFHDLYVNRNDNGCKNKFGIDTLSLFIASLFALIFYRIVSTIAIYSLPHRIMPSLKQFFDLELFNTMYRIMTSILYTVYCIRILYNCNFY